MSTPDPVTISERQLAVMNWWLKGWPALSIPPVTAEVAAALAGNATQESTVHSVALNVAEGSDGLINWLGARLDKMKTWVASNFGGDWRSLEGQAAYVIWEMKNDPADAGNAWKYLENPGSRTITTLVYDFCLYDERAGQPNMDKRVIYANQCYALLGAQPDSARIPAPPAPSAPPATPSGGTSSVSGSVSAADPEIAAIAEIWGLLTPFTSPAVSRMLTYLNAKAGNVA